MFKCFKSKSNHADKIIADLDRDSENYKKQRKLLRDAIDQLLVYRMEHGTELISRMCRIIRKLDIINWWGGTINEFELIHDVNKDLDFIESNYSSFKWEYISEELDNDMHKITCSKDKNPELLEDIIFFCDSTQIKRRRLIDSQISKYDAALRKDKTQ